MRLLIRLCSKYYGLFPEHFSEHRAIHCKGNGKIRKQINAYNNAAQYGHYFVITDLDDTYECASSLVTDWLPGQRSSQLLFRVAVHEVESWLLADKENFAVFFSISRDLIPVEPDNESDPKQTVISLARRSRKRKIREDIVPIDDYASIGPGYNIQFQKFIQNFWDINSARKYSPSLDRTIKSLESIII
ncbi:MAG: DUF4276 family protein [Spirochaetaceae bacterium]|nr:DUF4276 family protein [Spirochaetaceae bacterium]